MKRRDQPATGDLDNEVTIVAGRAQKMPKKSLDLQIKEPYVTTGSADGTTERHEQNTEKEP
jgi:hypothetical protein